VTNSNGRGLATRLNTVIRYILYTRVESVSYTMSMYVKEQHFLSRLSRLASERHVATVESAQTSNGNTSYAMKAVPAPVFSMNQLKNLSAP
jgi:hypothetical protein